MRVLVGWCISWCLLSWPAFGQENPPPLDPKAEARARRIEERMATTSRAYHQGNAVTATFGLTALLNELTDDELKLADELLTSAGSPTIAAMFAETRFAVWLDPPPRRLPKPSPEDAAMGLVAVSKWIATGQDELAKSPLLAGKAPAPKKIVDYSRRFEAMRRLEQHFVAASRMVNFAKDLFQFAKRAKRPDLTPEELAVVKVDWAAKERAFKEQYDEFRERLVEMRVQRLMFARRVLEDEDEWKTRLFAAAAVDQDGPFLVDLFPLKKNPSATPYRAAWLNNVELPRTIRSEYEIGVREAGDLIEKSRLFTQGVQWWMRGRYGRGPLFGGLAKPIANTSAAAQLAVAMPIQTPQPTDPTDGSASVPRFRRRHQVIWTCEERYVYQAARRIDTQTRTYYRVTACSALTPAKTETSTQVFHRANVINTKTLGPHRLVGFHEYTRALANLTKLVRACNDRERAALNEIIAERDEFAVFTNLSRLIQIGATTLDDPVRVGASYERRGLNWMMALARVELGAMLAGFSEHQSPFRASSPTDFEFDAFRDLLRDGVRVHVAAISQDNRVRVLASLPPSQSSLAYMRRMRIANSMIKATQFYGAVDLSATQQQHLTAWLKQIEEIQGNYFARLFVMLQSQGVSGSGSATVYHLPPEALNQGFKGAFTIPLIRQRGVEQRR
ncbi:MAG: hypothetical protein QGG36_27340 [Pirellulaceae bacterium]|nr:hypothetical protein [Pirellulaceae bacterium]